MKDTGSKLIYVVTGRQILFTIIYTFRLSHKFGYKLIIINSYLIISIIISQWDLVSNYHSFTDFKWKFFF